VARESYERDLWCMGLGVTRKSSCFHCLCRLWVSQRVFELSLAVDLDSMALELAPPRGQLLLQRSVRTKLGITSILPFRSRNTNKIHMLFRSWFRGKQPRDRSQRQILIHLNE
jgi:hypothetical protein